MIGGHFRIPNCSVNYQSTNHPTCLPNVARARRDNILPSVAARIAASTTNLPTFLPTILSTYQITNTLHIAVRTTNLPTNRFELRKITTSNNIYTTKCLIVGMLDFLYLCAKITFYQVLQPELQCELSIYQPTLRLENQYIA